MLVDRIALIAETASARFATEANATILTWRLHMKSAGFSFVKLVLPLLLAPVSMLGQAGLQFVPITPCRIVDTRPNPIPSNTTETFNLPQLAQTQGCASLTSAAAYSINISAIPTADLGDLYVWPTGQTQYAWPLLQSLMGKEKSDHVLVPAGTSGSINIHVSDASNLTIDIDGYFQSASTSTLAFFPISPCRVVETRNPNGTFGGPSLVGQTPRTFPMKQSPAPCSIPSSAKAYSLNFSVIPPTGGYVGFLQAWPANQQRPGTVILDDNTNGVGTVVANTSIVAAGTDQYGSITVQASQNTDLAVDITGYFASPIGVGGTSFYTVADCRAFDSRNNGGAFTGTMAITIGTQCGLSTSVKAYLFNASAFPEDPLVYLALWAGGQTQPNTSILNSIDEDITSNNAIVQNGTGSNAGMVDTFASSSTNLALDVYGYFN